MDRTELSPGGPALSPIGAGAWRMADWNWSPQERPRWIEQCVELGVTSFDHADIYGGYRVEALFGEGLALAPGLRERLQLIGKCGIKLVDPARPGHRIKHYDTSAAHITASVENSLHLLRTDRLDLLLIHRPDALLDADAGAGPFTALRAAGQGRRAGRRRRARARRPGGAGRPGAAPRLHAGHDRVRLAAAPSEPAAAGGRLAPHRGLARGAGGAHAAPGRAGLDRRLAGGC